MNESARGAPNAAGWIDRTIIAIIQATSFSDVSHEMCTPVLPFYLPSISLGPAALSRMERLAVLLMGVSRPAGA